MQWDELREEYYALKRQGYSGEGFLGTGHRLGGRAVPLPEIRRQARLAAEKRKTLSAGSGQRLGGSTVPRGTNIRGVIADAAERRNNITQGCGSGNHVVEQKAEEEARRLGFRTKAEMDDADKLAIAIAMMEGDRDANRQEMQALGVSEEGLSWSAEGGLEMASPKPVTRKQDDNDSLATTTNKLVSSPTYPSSASSSVSAPRPDRPVSRLVPDHLASAHSRSRPEVIDLTEDAPEQEKTVRDSTWVCEICTLMNNMQHLCCDACGVERPESVSKKMKEQEMPVTPRPLGWNCRRCGSFMEAQWWTCSACGLMKASS